jgi:hypothetical protein
MPRSCDGSIKITTALSFYPCILRPACVLCVSNRILQGRFRVHDARGFASDSMRRHALTEVGGFWWRLRELSLVLASFSYLSVHLSLSVSLFLKLSLSLLVCFFNMLNLLN